MPVRPVPGPGRSREPAARVRHGRHAAHGSSPPTPTGRPTRGPPRARAARALPVRCPPAAPLSVSLSGSP